MLESNAGTGELTIGRRTTAKGIRAGWLGWGAEPPPTVAARGIRGLGLQYESAVLAGLDRDLDCFTPHPVFFYRVKESSRVYRAIPDGLALHTKRRELIIIEVKLRHSIDAWVQLFKLYVPIVQFAFPDWNVRALEICKWYDGNTVTPTKPSLVDTPSSFVADNSFGAFGLVVGGRTGWNS